MFREPSEEEVKKIDEILKRKDIIKKLDSLLLGETLFIENKKRSYINSLYLTMKNKGKKFSQISQAIGYTMTRYE